MTTVTLTMPKPLRANDDLVVIPRKEYESLKARAVPEYTPTPAERRTIARARKNFAAGKTISLAQLKDDLARRGR